jgi:alkylation response protein AidB-like acyl-CoA dehydrogenase
MNFELSEDRRMLADMLDRFVAEQYGFADRTRIAYGTPGHSPELWARFAEQGAIGALFPEEDGGLGGSGFDIAIVFEALGRGLVPEPFLGALMGGAALAAGNTGQRALIESVIAGETQVQLAHEEAGGYDPAHAATHARRDGAQWVLDGTKIMVPCAETAQYFVVSARTSGGLGDYDSDASGISLFLVPAGTPGLHLRACATIDGGRAADLAFDDLRVPADALIGEADAGHAVLERALAHGIVALCAEAVGAMDAARDATLEYLRTRKQFGKPIGSFQALQHRMADLLIDIEQSRSSVTNAAAALADEDRIARERAVSAAKYTVGRVGIRVAEECIQLHGGIGMTWELPLAHYAKRLVMIDSQLGNEDQHLERYVALGSEPADTILS